MSAAVLTLHWLGVGSASAEALGSASVVLLRGDEPLLMVDCGPASLARYRETFGGLPPALYLTHAHLDHVGGLEGLFYALWFSPRRGQMPLFVPVGLVELLQSRLADGPGVLAEGGANFWDAFRLVPVRDGFWWQGLHFSSFPTRHHRPGSSQGLALRGAFVYTGDTRPIPEQLLLHAAGDELICHDCGLHPNPSHTGLADLAVEYPETLRRRLLLYHYGSDADGEALVAAGHRIARPGMRVELPERR